MRGPSARVHAQGALVLATTTPGRLALRAPALWLTGLVVLSTGLRFLAARATPAPSIFPDELIYFDLARSLALDGGFTVFGAAFSPWTYGVVYPVLISPIFLVAGDGEAAYGAIKLVNCLVASLAAVPAYFLARRFLTERRALLFAALCLALPSLVYTTKIMTESLAYPVFLLTFLGLQRALERPTTGRQVAALALLALAVFTRMQMVALVPAYVVAVMASAFLAAGAVQPGEVLRRFRPTLLLLAVPAVAAGALAATSGPDGILGLHAAVVGRVEWGRAPVWALYHLAEIDLAAGVVPLAAFVLLAAAALRRGDEPRELRIFVLLTGAVAVWLLTLAGLYATQPKLHGRIYERYVFYLVPLLLLALFIWLERGRRPARWGAVAVGGAALLPLAIPFGAILYDREWGVSSSTASLVPWAFLRLFTGSLAAVYVATAVLSLALASLTLLSRRSHVIPRALLLTFVSVSLLAQVASLVQSDGVAKLGVARDRPDWIDAAVGEESSVAAVWSGSDAAGWRSALPLWEGAFFNRSIAGLYSVSGGPLRHLPAEPIHGHGAEHASEYVLIDPTIRVDGDVVARDARTGMALVRLGGPLRVHASRYGRAVPTPR